MPDAKLCKMSSRRFFENPFEDYSKGAAEDVVANNQINPASPIVRNLESKWIATTKKLESFDSSDFTVYTGTAGIALLKLRKAPDDTNNLKEIKKLLQLDNVKKRRMTFLCGDVGPVAIGIIVCCKLDQMDEMKRLIKMLIAMKDISAITPDFPNEYMYGRAGYLYALLYVNKYVSPPPIPEGLIRKIIDSILTFGQQKSACGKFTCPLMYEWHDNYYLGAAHGICGILYLLLQAKNYLSETELFTLIKPTVDYLRGLRFPSGNYPSSVGSASDKHVQWCHGAPGFVYLFGMAYRVFGEQKYLKYALDAGDVVWRRGLLKKGYSLCHGVAGNTYCFLDLFQITKDDKHLYRAVKFSEWCIKYKKGCEDHPPDRPYSLFEGIVGPMYLLLDMQKPLEAKFPGFTV